MNIWADLNWTREEERERARMLFWMKGNGRWIERKGREESPSNAKKKNRYLQKIQWTRFNLEEDFSFSFFIKIHRIDDMFWVESIDTLFDSRIGKERKRKSSLEKDWCKISLHVNSSIDSVLSQITQHIFIIGLSFEIFFLDQNIDAFLRRKKKLGEGEIFVSIVLFYFDHRNFRFESRT